ncbi:fungal-specific transcription factor domain-containing protein [Aspergillus ambiguus]|uniref:Zn(II)2Cys6 transcription factor n=1 Tax=Aspergillus ambiguus TaxID=176160 RepID=UPI003CCD5EF5
MDSHPPYKRQRIRKSRGRGLRTKNGCITCRKRHLKCDEIKPLCGPCVKNDKQCEYAVSCPNGPGGASSILASNDASNNEFSALTIRETSPPHNFDDNRSRDVIADGPACSENETSLSSHCPGAEDNPPLPAVFDCFPGNEANTSQSPLSFHYTHHSPSTASFAAVRWFGLLASDAARDSPQLLTIPNTDGGRNLSLSHGASDDLIHISSLQQATRLLDSPYSASESHDKTGFDSSEARLKEEQIWQLREPIELSSDEQILFEHFVHHVSPWMDLFDPASQFSTFVPHLAVRNAGLMNAILALAVRHLALNPRLDNNSMLNKEEAALQYYYQTLHYVQRAMRYSSYKTSLELLATTLIVSAYEMLDNSTNDWERHLEGVFLIQRSQTIHGESGGLHSAVWWAWLCQDIWAAFREKRKALTFWVPQKPLSSLLPHELAARAIYITAKVVSYCAVATTEENIQRRMDGATRLRNMLDDWKQHLTIGFSPLPSSSRGHSSCFRPVWIRPPAFAVAIQFSNVSQILLLAHEPTLGGIDQYLQRQRMIERCVEYICGIAMTLKDDASSLMSSQALFIAGIFVQKQEARELILELLESCRGRTGWPVRSLGIELQELWSSNENESTDAVSF